MKQKSHNLNVLILSIIFVVFSCALYINSTTWFRLRLIENYKRHGQYVKAINLYNKILRKTSLRGFKNGAYYGIIYLDLGKEYAKLNLRNLAIESYAGGIKLFPDCNLEEYYFRNDLEKDKLLAIGLLEAGAWSKAIKELQRLKRVYPGFVDAKKYLKSAVTLLKKKAGQNNNNLLFIIGDAYVENQLFEEAKAFYTKRILDYGMNPLEVLSYLHQRYSKDPETKNKIWGKNIYVTLEDFECIEPILKKWVSIAKGKVNVHYITEEVAYKGNRSEIFDITYNIEEIDFWVKPVKIDLNNDFLPLGIRVFIKEIEPTKGHLKLNIIYPLDIHSWSGVWHSDVQEEIDKGWQVWRISDLFNTAKNLGLHHKADVRVMKIDKVIIDTLGNSGKFFVDEIELYISTN